MIMMMSLCLNSCIGLRSDISFRRDGSGTISLEYRISRELASLGELEANAPWPAVPVGREDFERTVARVPGLNLESYRSGDEEAGRIIRVKLGFASPGALAAFLDASGVKARFVHEGGENRLSLTLGATLGTEAPADPALADLAVTAFQGYDCRWSFSLPKAGRFSLTGASGRELGLPAGWTLQDGKAAVFSAPMGELLGRGVVLELVWPD